MPVNNIREKEKGDDHGKGFNTAFMSVVGVRHKVVSADRMPIIEMHSPSDPRQGFIEREQYEKLLKALPEWLQPVLTFAFQTGWRKQEILGLKWESIDLKERQITLPSRMSKNGKARPIYADDVVYKVLDGQKQRQIEERAESFPFVFHRTRSTGGTRTERKQNRHPERIGEFKKVWAKACEKARLEVFGKYLKCLVEMKGFEPSAYALRTHRSPI